VTSVALVVPRPGAPSGGHAYNEAVLLNWPGRPPRRVELDGPWPAGDAASIEALRSTLHDHATTLVDGLVGAAHPEVVAEAVAAGHHVVLLVHLPLADEGGLSSADRVRLEGLERAGVHAASRVVTTSRWAAVDLAARHGRDDVVAVPPGVAEAPVAERNEPPHLLQVGSIGPRKNQLATVAALAACDDLPWTATFVGPVADPAYAERLSAELPERACRQGPLRGAELERVFASADLLLFPSRAETWGMVVTEALARGIPALVTEGTGAVEALRSGGGVPGAVVPTDDPEALAKVLRRWLTSPAVRDEWRAAALLARPRLRRWPASAAALARLLEAR